MNKYLAVLLSLTLISCSFTKDPAQPFDAATTAKVDAAVTKVMSEYDIPGVVVGAWFPGRGEYVVAKGVRNLATGEPMRADLHFRIGSNTKAFTGTAILQLVDEGRFKLDDKISRWFPWVVRGDEITVRMLLNMTSGITSYTEIPEFEREAIGQPHRRWTRQEVLDRVKALPVMLMFDPGTRWHYSNTNTVLLGMIIEAETGKTVADAFRDRIYTPMAMSNTSWGGPDLPAQFTHGYTHQTPDESRADSYNWDPSWADAAGQLVSTMHDLRKWAPTLANPVLISPAMHAERIKWVTLPDSVPSYGLGIAKAGNWYHHQGSIPGYNTIALYLPELDATVVVLVNSDTSYGDSPAVAVWLAVIGVLSPEYVPRR